MKEALLYQGLVNVPHMTSCMDEWIAERHSIVRAVLPPAPDTQHNGKRSAPVLSPSSAKRLRRSKAPASAKRPTPKLAERGTPPEGVAEGPERQRSWCLVAQT